MQRSTFLICQIQCALSSLEVSISTFGIRVSMSYYLGNSMKYIEKENCLNASFFRETITNCGKLLGEKLLSYLLFHVVNESILKITIHFIVSLISDKRS